MCESISVPTVLVTGATGFVGSSLSRYLVDFSDFEVRGSSRRLDDMETNCDMYCAELSAGFDWSEVLFGVDVVIHTAARVHVMDDRCSDPLTEFRKVNVVGTLNLARQAVQAGVKRFVYISTIKVHGEQTQMGVPFRHDDILQPVDPYAVSKMEAEIALQQLARESQLEVVIIRPPLVYGPEVKANFKALIQWLRRGVFLPFGLLCENKRSFVSLANLIDLIVTCIDHPAAVNQIFLVCDGEDLSTVELLQRLARAMRRSVVLIPVPISILTVLFVLLKKSNVLNRLCRSLQIDMVRTQELLDWVPPVSVDEGLRRSVSCI